MTGERYELTAAQAAFLAEARHPSPRAVRSPYPSRARFEGRLPEIVDQSVRGTCVVSAVAALVACYEGCRRRVSVQYLIEVTRLVEHDWIARNMRLLLDGGKPEMDFGAAFPDAVSQIMLLVRVNGPRSEAATAFVNALAVKIRARVESDVGCRLRRCFEALEEYGVCREELWPYSPVALNVGAAGGDAVGEFPPGTHEDARRHRIVNGLYVLRAPNNVDEIKGILAGAQGRRPMPVCLGLELFEGRTDGAFGLPEVAEANGRAEVVQRPLGLHEVLVVGYTDDAKSPGGGYFTFRNSWGRVWGEDGMGRVSYAYVACFCREAGTILQERDEYGPSPQSEDTAHVAARRRATLICAVTICLAAAAVSIGVAVWALYGAKRPPLPPPPYPPPKVLGTNEPSDDDQFTVDRVVRYRFRLRGICDSTVEAAGMSYALDGEHREFSFENMHLTDDRHGFEGEMVQEGPSGRPPDPVETINAYLRRRKLAPVVRKWSVRRLK